MIYKSYIDRIRQKSKPLNEQWKNEILDFEILDEWKEKGGISKFRRSLEYRGQKIFASQRCEVDEKNRKLCDHCNNHPIENFHHLLKTFDIFIYAFISLDKTIYLCEVCHWLLHGKQSWDHAETLMEFYEADPESYVDFWAGRSFEEQNEMKKTVSAKGEPQFELAMECSYSAQLAAMIGESWIKGNDHKYLKVRKDVISLYVTRKKNGGFIASITKELKAAFPSIVNKSNSEFLSEIENGNHGELERNSQLQRLREALKQELGSANKLRLLYEIDTEVYGKIKTKPRLEELRSLLVQNLDDAKLKKLKTREIDLVRNLLKDNFPSIDGLSVDSLSNSKIEIYSNWICYHLILNYEMITKKLLSSVSAYLGYRIAKSSEEGKRRKKQLQSNMEVVSSEIEINKVAEIQGALDFHYERSSPTTSLVNRLEENLLSMSQRAGEEKDVDTVLKIYKAFKGD